MNDQAFGIREGEIAVELPKEFDASPTSSVISARH
jgi:hypothetical protein